jgi:hypothetical protein
LVAVVVAFCGCDFVVAFCADAITVVPTAKIIAEAIIRTFFIFISIFS